MKDREGSSNLLPMEQIPHASVVTTILPSETAPKFSSGPYSFRSRERVQASCVESAAGLQSALVASTDGVSHGDIIVSQAVSYHTSTIPHNNSDGTNSEVTRIDASQNKSADSQIGCIRMARRFFLTRDPLLYGITKWYLAALLLLFLTFIVFGVFYSGFHYRGNCSDSGKVPYTPCVTPFGSILGVYNGVFAYSNCNDSYTSAKTAYITLTVPKRNTETGELTYISKQFPSGMEWQCVEYARRYWMQVGLSRPAYFGSVKGAADIWNLTFVTLVSNASMTLPLLKYENGHQLKDDLQAPMVGDIIIYPVQSGGFPYGHVAVIVKVEMAPQGAIYVAEQNWENQQWLTSHHNYSRKISLHYSLLTSTVRLDDPDGSIIGWMRYQ